MPKTKDSETFEKACMYCKSFNIKVWPSDDNEAYGLNPKYECQDCRKVGMPVELAYKSKK